MDPVDLVFVSVFGFDSVTLCLLSACSSINMVCHIAVTPRRPTAAEHRPSSIDTAAVDMTRWMRCFDQLIQLGIDDAASVASVIRRRRRFRTVGMHLNHSCEVPQSDFLSAASGIRLWKVSMEIAISIVGAGQAVTPDFIDDDVSIPQVI